MATTSPAFFCVTLPSPAARPAPIAKGTMADPAPASRASATGARGSSARARAGGASESSVEPIAASHLRVTGAIASCTRASAAAPRYCAVTL